MKNIILIIIGLTILPNKRPNFIHNLLKGKSKSWKNNEIIKIKIDKDKDEIAYKIKLFTIKKQARIKKTIEKKNPNLLFEGNSGALKVI